MSQYANEIVASDDLGAQTQLDRQCEGRQYGAMRRLRQLLENNLPVVREPDASACRLMRSATGR